MHWKVLAPLHFVTYASGALAAVVQGCPAYLVVSMCDACAKGELVHAEARSTSDLVFGISNFAAIELY